MLIVVCKENFSCIMANKDSEEKKNFKSYGYKSRFYNCMQ